MTDQPQTSTDTPGELAADKTVPALEAEAVAAWLQQHPDFFAEHDELLTAMRIPHQRGDTVSLVERQLKLLRERNIEMRHRLSQLMDVARDNDRLFEKTRRLILALMDATSLEEIVIAVEDSLRQEFLFGAEQSKEVGSTAIVALNHQGLHGVLAIGSRDPQHYKSSVGTLFLTYIADVLSRLLPRFTNALRSVR